MCPYSSSWSDCSLFCQGSMRVQYTQSRTHGRMEPESHHTPEIYVNIFLLHCTSLLAAKVGLKLCILLCFLQDIHCALRIFTSVTQAGVTNVFNDLHISLLCSGGLVTLKKAMRFKTNCPHITEERTQKKLHLSKFSELC